MRAAGWDRHGVHHEEREVELGGLHDRDREAAVDPDDAGDERGTFCTL